MSNFFNDTASEYDYLGYKPYIEAFNYILNENNSLITPPLVFGIHGKWGEGKTTFMNLICRKIEKNFFTVNINPWEYGDTKKFITIFLAKLYDEVRKEKLKGKKESIEDFTKSIFKPLKLSLNLSPVKVDYDFEKFSFDKQQEVIDSVISENFALKKSINKILNNKIFNNKKIVIFIDDLDRCDVEKVMEVIESIKLVLNSRNCIFFIGCDVAYIQSALSNKYKAIIDTSKEDYWQEFSREYLEKIIQIPFYIPRSDSESTGKYIEAIIFDKKIPNKPIKIENNLFEVFKKHIHTTFIKEIIDHTKINPRRIKRIINLSFLNYVFLRFKDIKEVNIDNNLLILLCIIREVYPVYYRKNLSYKQTLIKVFNIAYDNYKNKEEEAGEKDFKIESGEIFKLLELYFEHQEIKSKKELFKKLDNVEIYINVNNISSSEEYDLSEWGDIANIKSEITGRKLKVFLEQINNNQNVKNFVFWFFDDLYKNNQDKIKLGIVKNVQVYDKENNKWLFRFDYNIKTNDLNVMFKWRRDNTCFDIDNELKNCKFYSDKNIVVNNKTKDEEIRDIKEKLEYLMTKYLKK